jgi:bleomycin hydrolase
MSEITLDCIDNFKTSFEANPMDKLMQSIISGNDINKLMTNRDVVQEMKYFYSHQVEPKVAITDQKRSGRCWLFAALNIIRRTMIRKYDLPKEFEFSQSYLFFWDKFERLNYHLELIIESWQTPLDSREVVKILDEPCEDGGQWDMFVSLVNKYGLVPKHNYMESQHSSSSADMRNILKKMFREVAMKVRNLLASGGTVDDARAVKKQFLNWSFDTLCKFMGTPPTKSTTFSWEYCTTKGKYFRVDGLTPQQFYQEFVPFNVSDYVCLVNDPRKEHPYYKLYVNIPIEHMKRVTYQSIIQNQAVWYGCDFGKERADCQMDLNVRVLNQLVNMKSDMTKEEKLNYGSSLMTHAMVITGCNIIDEQNGIVNRWQVENSHGKREPADGFCMMTDDWFTEYVYEVAIHRSLLTVEMLESLQSPDVIELAPWDPMGSLAH